MARDDDVAGVDDGCSSDAESSVCDERDVHVHAYAMLICRQRGYIQRLESLLSLSTGAGAAPSADGRAVATSEAAAAGGGGSGPEEADFGVFLRRNSIELARSPLQPSDPSPALQDATDVVLTRSYDLCRQGSSGVRKASATSASAAAAAAAATATVVEASGADDAAEQEDAACSSETAVASEPSGDGGRRRRPSSPVTVVAREADAEGQKAEEEEVVEEGRRAKAAPAPPPPVDMPDTVPTWTQRRQVPAWGIGEQQQQSHPPAAATTSDKDGSDDGAILQQQRQTSSVDPSPLAEKPQQAQAPRPPSTPVTTPAAASGDKSAPPSGVATPLSLPEGGGGGGRRRGAGGAGARQPRQHHVPPATPSPVEASVMLVAHAPPLCTSPVQREVNFGSALDASFDADVAAAAATTATPAAAAAPQGPPPQPSYEAELPQPFCDPPRHSPRARRHRESAGDGGDEGTLCRVVTGGQHNVRRALDQPDPADLPCFVRFPPATAGGPFLYKKCVVSVVEVGAVPHVRLAWGGDRPPVLVAMSDLRVFARYRDSSSPVLSLGVSFTISTGADLWVGFANECDVLQRWLDWAASHDNIDSADRDASPVV